MAQFKYLAIDNKGQETQGVIEAATDQEAIQQIRAQGLTPTKLGAVGGKAPTRKGKKTAKPAAKAAKAKKKGAPSQAGKRIKPKILMIFTRQLATLIDSGLPLLRGLNVLAKQEPNPVLRDTINAIADSVQSGSTFSESLAQHPKIFNKLYVNMVKAGELGGVLEVVLNRLAEYQEKAQKLKNKIVSAMVYPVIVLFIAVAIMTFLMLVIVPKFKDMFANMGDGTELPLISRVVFGFSDSLIANPYFLPNAVWVFLIIGIFFMLFKLYAGTEGGRKVVDSIKLKLPIFGDIQKKSAVARFSRTLGTLVTSGVPILQALQITRETAGNVIISGAVDKVHEAVKEGESIVTPMASTKLFPSMVISMVDVGEETGQLPEMLLKIADVYDDEVDNAVTALTSILEPLMIVFLALVVGAVVFALFLPLIKLITNVGA